eukprot:gene43471-53149_t
MVQEVFSLVFQSNIQLYGIDFRRKLADPVTDDHAATDDHGTDDGGHGTLSLFGSLEFIEGKTLMIGILVVVGAVLCLETLFNFLHSFTAETPFHDVVSAIEKELMVVGCTAFILKIVINTQTTM